jgi:CelD/BcsL family acetyltransferase involved in cellulose biosynthesis
MPDGQFREINDIREVPRVATLWKEALQATPGASFFQSQAWLEEGWCRFPRRQSLRLLVDANQPAVVPFCVRDEPSKVGPLRTLFFPLDDWSCEYLPLGAKPVEVLADALGHVRETARDWDLIDLRWVDQDYLDATVLAFKRAGFTALVTPRMERPVIDLRAGRAYERGLSKKYRQNLRRARQTLESMGDFRVEHVRPGVGDEPRFDLFDACTQIAKQSWQGAHEASFSSDKTQEFLRALHARAAAQGQADMTVVWLNGQPIAYLYAYCNAGRWIGFRNGYDPQFVKTGVGALALHESLMAAEALGDVFMDLGPGIYEYKTRAATDLRLTYSVAHYARLSVRPQLVKAWRHIEPILRGREETEKRRMVK